MNKPSRLRGRPLRAAAALALAMGMLAVFATVGGAGMARDTVSSAQSQYGKKVTLCHKGKKTIRVSKSAVAAHLRHGDTVGSCSSAAAKAKAAKVKAAKVKAAKAKAANEKAEKSKKSEVEKGKTDQGKTDQGKPDHGKPDHGKPDHGKPDKGKTKP